MPPKKPKAAAAKPIMGRPRVGDVAITMMFTAEDIERAEQWGKQQQPSLNRTAAIRLIFRRGLRGLK
jgi:hypothetical protein